MNKSYSWRINPASGDYVVANGSPVRDETLDFPVYVRLRTPRRGWLYAPDNRYGSVLEDVKRQNNQTSTLLANVMRDALRPLVETRRAASIDVLPTRSERFKEELGVTYVTRAGEERTFTFDPVEG